MGKNSTIASWPARPSSQGAARQTEIHQDVGESETNQSKEEGDHPKSTQNLRSVDPDIDFQYLLNFASRGCGSDDRR